MRLTRQVAPHLCDAVLFLSIGLLALLGCDEGCPQGYTLIGDKCVYNRKDAGTQNSGDAAISTRANETSVAGISAADAGSSQSRGQDAAQPSNAGRTAAPAGNDAPSAGGTGENVAGKSAQAGRAGSNDTAPAAGHAGGSGPQAGTQSSLQQLCGNGRIDSGETCDGACPTTATCKPTSTCQTADFDGVPELCTSTCTRTTITNRKAGDRCCPEGANSKSDPDCEPQCGNGVIEDDETCDDGPGSPHRCPSNCDDGQACTADNKAGSSSNCDVVCTNTSITVPKHGDGCCPRGAHAVNDHDCEPVCGNGITEAPQEQCDPNQAGWTAWTCDTSSCRPKTLYTSCANSEQCTGDEICLPDLWMCATKCDAPGGIGAASHCPATPAGSTPRCTNGIAGSWCVADCSSQYVCAPGLSCTSTAYCAGCATDEDCPTGKRCNIPTNTQNDPHGYCL